MVDEVGLTDVGIPEQRGETAGIAHHEAASSQEQKLGVAAAAAEVDDGLRHAKLTQLAGDRLFDLLCELIRGQTARRAVERDGRRFRGRFTNNFRPSLLSRDSVWMLWAGASPRSCCAPSAPVRNLNQLEAIFGIRSQAGKILKKIGMPLLHRFFIGLFDLRLRGHSITDAKRSVVLPASTAIARHG